MDIYIKLIKMTKSQLNNICRKMEVTRNVTRNVTRKDIINNLLQPLNYKYKISTVLNTSSFEKIEQFLLENGKMKDNDTKLFEIAKSIWNIQLGQKSNHWQQLCLLVNTPGPIRRGSIEVYFRYVHDFLTRCLKIIEMYPDDTIPRMLAFKMIQEHIYTIYHDEIKGHSVWKIKYEKISAFKQPMQNFRKSARGGRGGGSARGGRGELYSTKDDLFIFTLEMDKDKVGLVIGRKGETIRKLKSIPNVHVDLNNSTGTLTLSSNNFYDILNCAQQVNNYIRNNGILIKTIIGYQRWISGILFEIFMKYNSRSPISNNPFWLIHITGIGDLITDIGEVFELKMNESNAMLELDKNKYTGVAFLKKGIATFAFKEGDNIVTIKSQPYFIHQQEIVSTTVEMINKTQDGFNDNDNFFRF